MNYITVRAKTLGLKLIDGKKTLLIKVTTGDIRKGKIKDPRCCALSLACRRKDNRILAAHFFKSTAWLEYADKIVRYRLPASLAAEILAFDRSKSMEPGEYHLAKPPHAFGYKKAKLAQAKNGKKSKTIPRVQPTFHHVTTNVRTTRTPYGKEL